MLDNYQDLIDELLGTPQLVRDALAGGNPDAIRLVLEKEPERPSMRNSKVDRDLETICLKCLEKDPGTRYGSALGLAEDLERWLRQEPIVARPSTFFERAGKWARRKPVVAGLGATTLLLLLVVAIGAPIQTLRINRARQQALQDADQLRRNLYVADINVAAQAIRDQQTGRAREVLKRHRDEQDLRGVEWGYLWHQCQPDFTHSLDGHSNILQCVTFSPNGDWLATADYDHIVKIWDADSHECLKTLGETKDFDGPVDLKALAFSPDGKFLALKAGARLQVWRSSPWEEVTAIRVAEPRRNYNEAVVFSPDGKLLTTRMAGGIGFVDATAWRTNELFLSADGSFDAHGSFVSFGNKEFGSVLSYSADGHLLIVADGPRLQIRDAHDPFVTLTNLARSDGNQRMRVLSVTSSKEHVAAGYRDGVIALWDRRTWREIVLIRNPQPSHLVDLAFSPDGRLLASSGTRHVIQIWSMAQLLENAAPNWQPSLTLRGHSGVINALAFSPDGRILASASSDRTVKLWSVSAESASSSLEDAQDPCWFSPDEKKFIAVHSDGQCHLWDLERWQHLGQAGPIVDKNTLRAISPGGDSQERHNHP
jgi:WD40 repeat protein